MVMVIDVAATLAARVTVTVAVATELAMLIMASMTLAQQQLEMGE